MAERKSKEPQPLDDPELSESDQKYLATSQARGHEVRDAHFSNLLVYGFGMLVLVLLLGVVGSVVTYRYMGWLTGLIPATPQFQVGQQQLPPVPRLEVQGPRDLVSLRLSEQRQLDSYGWVDKNKGIVRIPISRAMGLIAAQAAGSKK
jgi:hypothetical protein